VSADTCASWEKSALYGAVVCPYCEQLTHDDPPATVRTCVVCGQPLPECRAATDSGTGVMRHEGGQ